MRSSPLWAGVCGGDGQDSHTPCALTTGSGRGNRVAFYLQVSEFLTHESVFPNILQKTIISISPGRRLKPTLSNGTSGHRATNQVSPAPEVCLGGAGDGHGLNRPGSNEAQFSQLCCPNLGCTESLIRNVKASCQTGSCPASPKIWFGGSGLK